MSTRRGLRSSARPGHLAVVLSPVLALLACERLLGGDDGAECARDADCYRFEHCDPVRGRCASAPLLGGGPDADATPATVRDATPDMRDLAAIEDVVPLPVDVPDLALRIPDAEPPDMADALPPDQGVVGIYLPDGDCFEGDPTGAVAESEGARIPRSVCTDEALLWTTTDAAGTTSLNLRQGAEDRVLTALPRDAEWTLREAVLLVVLPNADLGDAKNVFQVALTGGQPPLVAVEPSRAPQWHATRGPGLTGFVQRAPDGVRSGVRLHFDDGRVFDCGVPGVRQWGLTAGSDFVAWFEQPVAGGPTDLVTTRGLACEGRIAATLTVDVSPDERLLHDGERLYWMAVEPTTRQRLVYTAEAGRLAAGAMPLDVPGINLVNPVELAAHDGWLLVSSYEQRAYRLRLYDLNSRVGQSPIGQGSARAPALSGRYALWSQQSGGNPWEIRYAQLPRRR